MLKFTVQSRRARLKAKTEFEANPNEVDPDLEVDSNLPSEECHEGLLVNGKDSAHTGILKHTPTTKKSIVSILSSKQKKLQRSKRSQSVPRSRTVSFKLSDDEDPSEDEVDYCGRETPSGNLTSGELSGPSYRVSRSLSMGGSPNEELYVQPSRGPILYLDPEAACTCGTNESIEEELTDMEHKSIASDCPKDTGGRSSGLKKKAMLQSIGRFLRQDRSRKVKRSNTRKFSLQNGLEQRIHVEVRKLDTTEDDDDFLPPSNGIPDAEPFLSKCPNEDVSSRHSNGYDTNPTEASNGYLSEKACECSDSPVEDDDEVFTTSHSLKPDGNTCEYDHNTSQTILDGHVNYVQMFPSGAKTELISDCQPNITQESIHDGEHPPLSHQDQEITSDISEDVSVNGVNQSNVDNSRRTDDFGVFFHTLPKARNKTPKTLDILIPNHSADTVHLHEENMKSPTEVKSFKKHLNGLLAIRMNQSEEFPEAPRPAIDDNITAEHLADNHAKTYATLEEACTTFLRGLGRDGGVRTRRSSGSSRTSDLSSMSRGSSQNSSRVGVHPHLGDTSYLVDSPSQDSSSGIASDDHHTATSETSPTGDLTPPRAKVNLRTRFGQGAGDALGAPWGCARGGGSRSSNRSSDGKDYGYHETNLDDPSSDGSFVFPMGSKRTSTASDGRSDCTSVSSSAFVSSQRAGGMGHRVAPNVHAPNAQQLRTTILHTPVIHNGSLKQGIHPSLSYFDLLSDDLLLQILRHLPTEQLCRCARISQRFYALAWDPLLWTSIRLHDANVDVDRAIRTLTKRLSFETPTVCAIVETISLSGCERLTDRGLYTIARRCPELRQLNIQGCPNVSNIALNEVLSNCVNLEHLNVAGCPCVTCIALTPEATVQAATYGKQVYLRHLDMTECHGLEDSGLQIIASYCTRLTYVYLRRCPRLTDVGIQYLANYCTELRELSISDCRNVTDFGLRELSRLGANLRYLSVAKCEKITDVGIRYIARFCTRLRYLNVRGCEGVTDDSIEILARCCTRMRSLDVGKCDITDDGLESLGLYCKQLKKLSLKSCEAVTDRGLCVLAQKCRGLQQLNIQDCNFTVEAYRMVKKYCKRCIIEHTNPGFY